MAVCENKSSAGHRFCGGEKSASAHNIGVCGFKKIFFSLRFYVVFGGFPAAAEAQESAIHRRSGCWCVRKCPQHRGFQSFGRFVAAEPAGIGVYGVCGAFEWLFCGVCGVFCWWFLCSGCSWLLVFCRSGVPVFRCSDRWCFGLWVCGSVVAVGVPRASPAFLVGRGGLYYMVMFCCFLLPPVSSVFSFLSLVGFSLFTFLSSYLTYHQYLLRNEVLSYDNHKNS